MITNVSEYSENKTCNPTITVILPTFNRAKFLGEAILSVLNQSFKNFELIVVDDGSEDSTADIVRSFNDPRLIFIKQEKMGRSSARNRAISIAQGEFVAFIDSDDVYFGSKLQRQLEFMLEHPEFSMVYTSASCIDTCGNVIKEKKYEALEGGDIYYQIVFFRPITITLPTVMLRKSVLDIVGCFDEAMERFEDIDLWRRVAKKYFIGAMNEITCQLRTHDDNDLCSQDPNKIVDAIEYYVEKVFAEDKDLDVRILKNKASLLYEYYGRALISISGWRYFGYLLFKKSAGLCHKRILIILYYGFRSFAGSIIRDIFNKKV